MKNNTLQKYYNYEVLNEKQAEIAELRQQAVEIERKLQQKFDEKEAELMKLRERSAERERKLRQKKFERYDRKQAVAYAKEVKKKMRKKIRNQKKEIFMLKHPVIAKIQSFLYFLSFEDALFYIVVFLAIAFFAILLPVLI